MTGIRIVLLVVAAVHALFVGFTALAGAFADGGGIWQRLLLVLLHPLGAAGVLALVLRPRSARNATLAIAAILATVVIADLALAQRIATGLEKGDWELALIFAAVPALGLCYTLNLLRTGSPAAR